MIWLIIVHNYSYRLQKNILMIEKEVKNEKIANMITSNIKEYHLTQEDQVEVLALAMKNLGILDKSIFLRKPTKSGHKLTYLMTRQEVWKFWHDQSILSTNTQQIAKLRVIDKL